MEKRRELEKAARERKEFRAAADVAGLQIVLRSIRSRQHPEPDILCTLRNGERVAFELDQSPFRRLLVVNLGPLEPGLWLDRVREP